MKKLTLLLLLGCSYFIANATHNRAGEITYTWLNGLTYEVTVTTYTRSSSPADRCELEIFWGDNTSTIAQRTNGFLGTCPSPARMGEPIGNDIQKNVYVATHTYLGSGNFSVFFEDPNRNSGVSNIPGSVNVPFYVESQIIITPGILGNTSPVLTNPPIDDGCLNSIFKHNPGAVDPDRDSLYYSLVVTRTTGGAPINTTYDTTIVQDPVTINPQTGDLIWDKPQNAGQFNFAIQIDEWRLGPAPALQWFKVGSVTRDLQVDIQGVCTNLPPEVQPVGPFCVEAGTTLNFDVTAFDPDGNSMNFRAFGDPYEVPFPADEFDEFGASPLIGTFNWNTNCDHISREPYFVTFEAKDIPDNRNDPRLTDIFTAEIQIIAPAPQNPIATPQLNTIQLQWSPGRCDAGQNTGYKIYRRQTLFGFNPSDCEVGVPAYTGYQQVGQVSNTDTSYIDSIGLDKGVEYCYMIVSCFPNDVESYASIEFCASLPLTSPLMTKVDVISTDLSNGSIDLEWISPPILDSTLFPAPYEYRLYYTDSIDGTDFSLLQTLQGIGNTTFTHNGINTQEIGHNYRVDFYSGSPPTFVASSPTSSSVYLDILPIDEGNLLTFEHNTSWLNDTFIVFRETAPGSTIFDSIDVTPFEAYIDSNLTNGTTYCYRVQSIGAYTASDSLPRPLINHSQINCATPLDTTLPCAPEVNFVFDCDSGYLEFNVLPPINPACTDDIAQYRLYRKPTEGDSFGSIPIETIDHPNTKFVLMRDDIGQSLTGCYAITAIDDADQDVNGEANESLLSRVICIDGCPSLLFPNVFTPNGDGINETFLPINPQDITYINIKIFNRWGTSIYKTDNIRFLVDGWDGTDENTGQLVSDGVYYYVCQYSANTLTGPPLREVTGYVHLFNNNQ